MKSHPRIRKTNKWGGAVVTVLLAVVWIGSGWWKEHWIGTDALDSTVARGRLHVRSREVLDYPEDWPVGSYPRPQLEPSFVLVWTGRFYSNGSTRRISVPLWMFVAPLLLATITAWMLDRREQRRCARLNLCRTCGYDRTGLAADVPCPECGLPAPAARS